MADEILENEQNGENQTTTRESVMQGGRNVLQGASSLLSNLHRFVVGEDFLEFAQIPKENKRFLFGITMSDNVQKIGEGFASNSKHVREAILSSALTEIPDSAFEGCGKLSVVNFDHLTNLKAIRENAFADTNIRSIPNMDNLQIIDKGAFNECTKLRHLNFGQNSEIRVINDYAFNGCKRLVDQKHSLFGGWGGKFDLPPKLEVLGKGAFGGCHKIRNITIPESCREITGNPFSSPSDYKKNGKMKLRSRWRNWHCKVDVPGLGKIRAKNFTSMQTTVDGLRYLVCNSQYMVEIEHGKFVSKTKAEYEAWKNEKDDDLVANTQVSREAFVSYLAEKGINISIDNVALSQMDKFNRAKNDVISIPYGKKTLEISVLDMKTYSAKFEKAKSKEMQKTACEEKELPKEDKLSTNIMEKEQPQTMAEAEAETQIVEPKGPQPYDKQVEDIPMVEGNDNQYNDIINNLNDYNLAVATTSNTPTISKDDKEKEMGQ